MPLSPAEREELAILDAYFEEKELEKAGQATIQAHRAVVRPPQEAPAPQSTRAFSTWTALVGGVRDAFEGIADTIDDAGDFLSRKTGIGGLVFGDAARNGLVEYLGYEEFNRRGGDFLFGRAGEETEFLPQLEGSEHAGTAENLVRGLVSFAVPFTAALKATSALRGFGVLGRVGQGLAAGAAADFVQVDPVGGNIANILRDTFGIDNAMLDSLAAEEDDSALMTRFKAAAAGAPLGLIGDAAFEAGGRLLKLYRAWKGTADEAAATVESYRQGAVKLDPVSRAADEAGEAAPGAARAADDGVPVVEADEVYDPVPPELVLKARNGEADFDDVLDFLKSKAGDIDMDEETFGRFARNLAEGDPENVLAKLGIDPAKIDFSKYDDPEMLARLQKGLAEVYEGLAARLGRSNVRVSEKAIIRGAEALASTPDVLRELYGRTSGLAEELTAGRLIVGAHAHKLIAEARAALDEIAAGGAGEAWAQFLESFHRHAYYLGALRGASTEVGRALRSLQIIAKVDKKTAGKMMDEALDADTAAREARTDRMSMVDGASAFARNLETDAEKMAALQRLIDLGGDVGELSRAVRRANGSVLRRWNAAIKETVGSLFGVATATYNLGAGLTFLGMNALGRLAAAAIRAPFGGPEAQRAALEAWAYTEGILGGFREAWGNTLAVLEREGMSELAMNLDGLGLERLAKMAQTRSVKAGQRIGEHFERADVVNYKEFAMTVAERRMLKEAVDNLPGPRFFQAGLRGLVNLTAAAVNAAGSTYRLGTTLFINLSDEFSGTLATRAGAYSAAVQIAAREAGDLGLRGADLSAYIKARTVQLFGDGPKGWSPAGVDGGARETMAALGEAEAKMVLFQDALEGKWLRSTARWVDSGGGLASLVIPFVRTPLRILERTAVDFTPLGIFKARIRKAIAAGGSQRDEALARMSLSMIALFTAFQLAEDRQIVGHDGGFTSTARAAGRPSYSLKVGGDVWEFSRLDPIGTLLGFGADLRVAMDAAEDDPEAQGAFTEIIEAVFWATAANVLSKTWLTSIKSLTDLAGADSENDLATRWENYKTSLAVRAVPAAGVQRSIEAWGDAQIREAAGFSDGLLKATIGANTLPVKRDFLGRPVEMSGPRRVAGLQGGPLPFEGEDPLMVEMERLSMRQPSSARRQRDVKLNASQFSRFLELRGQVVRDPVTGLTMEEALTELVKMPEYQALPKAARIAEVRAVTRGYSELAAEALTNEDRSFALAQLRVELFNEAAVQGWDPERRETELTRFAQELGLQ